MLHSSAGKNVGHQEFSAHMLHCQEIQSGRQTMNKENKQTNLSPSYSTMCIFLIYIKSVLLVCDNMDFDM